jgi:hypothetical protein
MVGHGCLSGLVSHRWVAQGGVVADDRQNLVTIGVHDPTILGPSLIADIALPILLLAHIPLFVGRASNRARSTWLLSSSHLCQVLGGRCEAGAGDVVVDVVVEGAECL